MSDLFSDHGLFDGWPIATACTGWLAAFVITFGRVIGIPFAHLGVTIGFF
jgi:hypothetical protein